jgi:hypothetical protein
MLCSAAFLRSLGGAEDPATQNAPPRVRTIGVTTDQLSDEEVDALLARGKVAGPARDAIWGRVLAGMPRQAASRRAWIGRAAVALGALAGAAALVTLVVPAGLDPFRAKGGGPAPVALDLACEGGTLAACPVGATLLFAVSGEADGFLGAFAEPRRGGERVWYFSADGETPRVRTAGGTTASRRAIRIGGEHAPGDYVVRILLSRAPLGRAAQLAGVPDKEVVARRDVQLRVVARAAPPPGAQGGAR